MMPSTPTRRLALDFDIDRYINPFIPRSRLHLLPKPVSWVLGYRSTPQFPVGSLLSWWWAFLGALCGILVVEAVFRTPGLQTQGTPIIISSFGASAILEYNTIDSPLAQPRNVIFGQLFASIIGVGITKLFELSPNVDNLRFVAGALAVGVASAFMGFTKTLHPPAGATALLATTSPEMISLGWFLIPLIMLGNVLMLAVACLLNNIQRQFPLHWWTPVNLSTEAQQGRSAEEVEEGDKPGFDSRLSYDKDGENDKALIIIGGDKVSVPDWLELDAKEKAFLEVLRLKLQERGGLRPTDSRDSNTTHVHSLSLDPSCRGL